MKKEKPQKTKMVFISIITLFAILSDIYIIINMPRDYTILIVASLVTLIFSIITLCSWINYHEKENMYREEQYMNITKLQKSTYMGIQKKFQNVDDKLNFIGQKIMPLEKANNVNQKKIASMLENLMAGQKKVAKVTVGRNKENTQALMNSNDKLLVRMDNFQDTIESIKDEILSKETNSYQQDFQEIKDNVIELKEKIQILENLIKEENKAISENIAEIKKEEQIIKDEKNKQEKNAEKEEISSEDLAALLSEVGTMLEEPIEKTEDEVIFEEPIEEAKDEIVFEEPIEEVKDEIVLEEPIEEIKDEIVFEEPIEEVKDEIVFEEPIEEVKDEIVLEEPVVDETEINELPEEPDIEEIIEETNLEEPKTKDEMSLEDMTALLSEAEMMLEDSGSEETEIMLDDPAMEGESDTIIVDEPVQEESDTVIADEPVQEESDTAIVDEPVQEEVKSEAEKSLDMMSPEDIASLISNVMSEELPETTTEIEKEEKPPMPDTSDPNKQMSPEDIAALIANM